MAKKTTGVPPVPSGSGSAAQILQALKDNIEFLLGQRGNVIKPLATTATLDDVIAKVNELVARLNP